MCASQRVAFYGHTEHMLEHLPQLMLVLLTGARLRYRQVVVLLLQVR